MEEVGLKISNEWAVKSEMACRQDVRVDGTSVAEGLVFRAGLITLQILPCPQLLSRNCVNKE
jgi:hypothetical protein